MQASAKADHKAIIVAAGNGSPLYQQIKQIQQL